MTSIVGITATKGAGRGRDYAILKENLFGRNTVRETESTEFEHLGTSDTSRETWRWRRKISPEKEKRTGYVVVGLENYIDSIR